MIQDFDSQLQVALTALTDVVAPAMGSADKHVVEQLHLAVLTLSFVKERLPEARAFYRTELRGWVDLAGDLAAIATSDALDTAAAQGEGALGDPAAELADVVEASRGLRSAITAASAAISDSNLQRRFDAAILASQGPMIAQSRLWCAPFGFELQLDKLPAPAWRDGHGRKADA